MNTTDVPSAIADPIAVLRDALLERLNQSLTNMMELCAVYLGERLDFYTTLATSGPLTASELATATETHERYAREWLEQQTLAGILEVENLRASPCGRG